MPPKRKASANEKEKVPKVVSGNITKKTSKSPGATKRNAKLAAEIPELVFKRRATQIFTDLCSLIPNQQFDLVVNEGLTPRRGAFEISVKKSKSDEPVMVWSGIKKGPPRKDKFPEAAEILNDVLAGLELN